MKLLIAVTILLATSCFAAETEPAPLRSNNALIFNINGLNVTSVDGGIGIKHWWLPSIAMRYAFNFSVAHSKENSVSDPTRTYESTSTDFGGEIDAEYHFPVWERISPYVASGILFSRHSSSQTNYATSSWNDYGVNVAFGLEYHVTPILSIAAQHRIFMTYQYTGGNYTVRVSTGTSSLILGLYF